METGIKGLDKTVTDATEQRNSAYKEFNDLNVQRTPQLCIATSANYLQLFT